MFCALMLFFFSSRRRHTRFKCDWSSDVCSSDLARKHIKKSEELVVGEERGKLLSVNSRYRNSGEKPEDDECAQDKKDAAAQSLVFDDRSEERRVGKECRY